MKKKNTSRDNVNLFFSAFLILAYIICAYFFASFATQQGDALIQSVIMAVVLCLFGLLVFYATRVGEGKTVKRFSLVTLIVLDLPALYIILASIIAALPFHTELAANPVVAYMAAVAFGYGVPYTFISGFETVGEDEPESEEEVSNVLEGGLEEDILENAPVEKEQTYEPNAEEIVVEGENIIETEE